MDYTNEEKRNLHNNKLLTAVIRPLGNEFHKSIIRSKSSMTYEQAQNRIDDPEDDSNLAKSLRILLKLSRQLKQRRIDAGALLLASSEVRFNVDSETADPIDVQAKVMRETNSMVEEFMLAANISAAERIYQYFPDCAVLRRHPAPPPSNFDPLVKAAKQQGHEIIIDTGKQLADSLNSATDGKRPYLNTMLRMIATRCMMQARYFASGTIEYSLFKMAQYAGRASVNLYTHLFFRNRKRDETGYILYIRQNAVQVLIPKYGLEGTLFLTKKKKNEKAEEFPWIFNEDEPSVTLDGQKLSLFQKVDVQVELDSTDIQHEKLVLSLVNPVFSGFSVPAAPACADDVEVDAKDDNKKRKSDSQVPTSETKKKKSS